MNTFGKIINDFKKDTIFIAIGVIIIGLLFAIFPSVATTVFCYLIGAMLLAGGIFKIVEYFKNKNIEVFGSLGLVIGTLLSVVGIVFIVNPTILIELIITVIAVIIIADGVLKIQYAVNLARVNARGWWVFLALGIALSVVGIIAMLSPLEVSNAIMMAAGIVLIIDGVIDIVTVIYASKALKNFNDEIVAQQALNVEATPVDDKDNGK